MRKLYHPVLVVIICTLFFTSIHAQRKLNRTQRVITKPSIDAGIVSPQGTTADCDTINYPFDTSWSAITYPADAAEPFDSGYINGTNAYQDRQKADYFDLSATANTHLFSVFVAFGNANSSVTDNLAKLIYFRIYE